ncbi:MAG: hypothetical protein ACRESI_04750 [Gammaproteobacteria bacterium]
MLTRTQVMGQTADARRDDLSQRIPLRRAMDMRVMLVDDNALFLNTLAELLTRKRGIQVVGHATNGDDGLRLAAELKPDV